jgi:hypothetical protein
MSEAVGGGDGNGGGRPIRIQQRWWRDRWVGIAIAVIVVRDDRTKQNNLRN